MRVAVAPPPGAPEGRELAVCVEGVSKAERHHLEALGYRHDADGDAWWKHADVADTLRLLEVRC